MIDSPIKTGSDELSLCDAIRTVVQKHLMQCGKERNLPTQLYADVLTEVEISLFEKILEYTNGFENRTARMLGISRNTLRSKLKNYGLDKRVYRQPSKLKKQSINKKNIKKGL